MMKKALLGLLIGVLAIGCQQQAGEQAQQSEKPATQMQTGKAPAPKPAMRQSDARVSVQSTTAQAGGKGSFKVTYYGVEEAKAIVVPLKVPMGMTVDSISFAGGMLDYIATRPIRIDTLEHQFLFTAIPTTEALIPAKEGVLATIHFTLSSDAKTGMIEEAFIPPANYLAYVDTSSVQVEPVFEPGTLTVQ